MKSYLLLIASCGIAQLGFTQTQKQLSEYADILVEAYYSGANPDFDDFYGVDGDISGSYKYRKVYHQGKFIKEMPFFEYILEPVSMNPSVVLGINPDYLCLPTGSYVIVQFTDNILIDAPNQDDIYLVFADNVHVFAPDPALDAYADGMPCIADKAEVYVSADGENFVLLGTVDDCNTTTLDLADIGFEQAVRFVKVLGLDNGGFTPGYDLVAIEALPNSNVDTYAGIDRLDEYLSDSLSRFPQKIILERVLFDFNSFRLLRESQSDLDLLASKLLKYPQAVITITGHTDDVGEEASNLRLSQARAQSVYDYLIQKGIPAHQITSEGKGESEPLKSNDTEAGRQANRRVEIERVK